MLDTCLMKGFNKRSIRSLGRYVKHTGPTSTFNLGQGRFHLNTDRAAFFTFIAYYLIFVDFG